MSPRRNILCIEDDQETAQLIGQDLEHRGYEVSLAHDGNAGLTAILTLRPGLVLCDVNLPGMSGFELLKSLTSIAPEYDSMPFIFVTGRRDRDSEMIGRGLGADDYIIKPIDLDRLAAIIDVRLGRGPRHRVRSDQVGLNDREIACLTWVARGKSSVEIAAVLGISKRVVDFHIATAGRKLGSSSRAGAVSKAITDRLICP